MIDNIGQASFKRTESQTSSQETRQLARKYVESDIGIRDSPKQSSCNYVPDTRNTADVLVLFLAITCFYAVKCCDGNSHANTKHNSSKLHLKQKIIKKKGNKSHILQENK